MDPVENGLYEWTGPNNFTATGLEVDLGAVNLQDSETYVVQGFTGECEIENDTIEVVSLPPRPFAFRRPGGVRRSHGDRGCKC